MIATTMELVGDVAPDGTLGDRRIVDLVHRVARLDTTVLLGGETGTGKTRLARLIHQLSPRRDQPFLVVNCGALSSNLIESEMFGHVRGAFTGADKDRTGKFAEVGRGTLLLDDVDALPPSVQAKLLRVVEDRLFEPVGSNETMPVHARLIAASNRPLDREAAAGRFRSDLYYRLNVVSFHLPPLRERPPGVMRELAEKFVAELCGRLGRPGLRLSGTALEALEAYRWPGNVRELRNIIERAVALAEGPWIGRDDLPDSVLAVAPRIVGGCEAERDADTPGESTLEQVRGAAELSIIRDALLRHGNNRLRAASALGISRMTLYKKLHKYGLMETAG
jgi:DNA-binding NtrC family response regulator